MGCHVNHDVWGPNSLAIDMNYWTISTGDLFIVVKISEEPAIFVGSADNRFSWTTLLRFWLQSFSFSYTGCPTKARAKSIELF